MKPIGISDFKNLVLERLSNPELFKGKTLVLWEADYLQYGMAYRIIMDTCIEYNRSNVNDQAWFKYSDLTFDTDCYDNIKECCTVDEMYGFKTRGILFNTGCIHPNSAQSIEKWLKFVNTHENDNGRLSNEWPLIACAQAKDYNLTEDQFGSNCKIYALQPNVDEWAEWIKPSCNQQMLKAVLSYIGKNGLNNSLDYWLRVINAIETGLEEGQNLNDMSEKDFELAVKGVILDFPTKDFWNHIHSNC